MFSRKTVASPADEVVQIERNLNAFTIKMSEAKKKLVDAKAEGASQQKLAALFRNFKSVERQVIALESALSLIDNAKGVAVITQAQQTATKVIKSVTKNVDHEAINDAHLDTAEMLNDANASLMALPTFTENVDDELEAFFAEPTATPPVVTKQQASPAPILTSDMPSVPTNNVLPKSIKTFARVKVYNGSAQTAAGKKVA